MNRGGPRLIPLSTPTGPPARPARRFLLPLTVLAVLSAVLIAGFFVSRGNRDDGDESDAEAADGSSPAAGQAAVVGDSAAGHQSLTTVIGASAAATATRVFLDLTHNGTAIGRLTLGLFDERAPKTVANFVALATGKGGPPVDGVPGTGTAGYAGVAFHRIIAGFMAQGGDYERGDGRGGKSIYPGGVFDDEPFVTTHDSRGVLSMANSGPNTNGAQFFITFKAVRFCLAGVGGGGGRGVAAEGSGRLWGGWAPGRCLWPACIPALRGYHALAASSGVGGPHRNGVLGNTGHPVAGRLDVALLP